MPPDLLQALLDPTAPIPAWWPSGAGGALLLFMFPVGGGIPAGVLMARNDGVALPVIALLYLVSDLVLAVTSEPMLLLVRWLGRRIALLGRMGERLEQLSTRIGLRDEGARGPLGLVLVSFAVSPMTGRAAASAAGHGFLSGWALAITGDMGYFLLLMFSTLGLSTLLGNDRLAVGVMLGVTWFLPLLLRRWSQRPLTPAAAPAPMPEQRLVAGSGTSFVSVTRPGKARRRRKR